MYSRAIQEEQIILPIYSLYNNKKNNKHAHFTIKNAKIHVLYKTNNLYNYCVSDHLQDYLQKITRSIILISPAC